MNSSKNKKNERFTFEECFKGMGEPPRVSKEEFDDMLEYYAENSVFIEELELTEDGFVRNKNEDMLKNFSVAESKRIYIALKKDGLIGYNSENESVDDYDEDFVLQGIAIMPKHRIQSWVAKNRLHEVDGHLNIFRSNLIKMVDGKESISESIQPFSVKESKRIAVELVAAGILPREMVEDHVNNNDVLYGVAIMPGDNQVIWGDMVL